jgi:phosphatidylethanolamine/phosphatidyl-N-methylethanolamine N-methyltransferase
MSHTTYLPRSQNPKSFSVDLGFAHDGDLSRSIPYYFYKDKGLCCQRVYSRIRVTCKRFNHFFRTHVWINEQKLGQQLNQYRFQKGISKERMTKIEEVLNKNISSDFTQKAYTAATKETFSESVSNNFAFFCQFVKSPATVGSLLPSSQKLAKEMVRELPEKSQSGSTRRFLEVGPGTGTFTAEFIEKLRKEDQLDLVEFDEQFVNVLRKRFGHMSNVHILHQDFTTFTTEKPYDHALSGLPLASFPPEMVRKIYDVFDRVIKKGGTVTYFEYIGLPRLKRVILRNKAKIDFQKVLMHKDLYYKQNNGTSTPVWLNLTPARVCRVKV